MSAEMIISNNDAVAMSSRALRGLELCATPAFWQHRTTIATAAKYATKRNVWALEELRTE